MRNSEAPKPPKDLSREAKHWWRELVDEYQLDDVAALLILQTGLEAFDRMRRAQALLKSAGEVVNDRFGQEKAHPAIIIERDSRAAMMSALRQLNLDLEPLRASNRRPVGG